LAGKGAPLEAAVREEVIGPVESADSASAPTQESKSAQSRQVIGRDRLGALTKIGQGGQGVVYRAPNVKTAFAASMVYKEYKPQTRGDIDFAALAAMPALVEESLTYAQAERMVSVAAWPCVLVEDGGESTGFVMPAIPVEFFIPFKTVKGVSTAAAEFQHLLNHSSVLAARGIDIDDAQRYTLLREVASGLAFLHQHGVCVGDISPKNLLFSLHPHEAVYFIDCDAMRINGVSALPQVETPGWEVPAGEELATVHSDAYKLGLLALRLLAGDHDTKNPQHLPDSTPGLLRQVVTDTLSKGSQERPLPGAWTYVLGNAIEQAQYQKKSASSTASGGVSPTAPLPPATPVLHSRPSARPSAPPPPPPPPPPQARPPAAAWVPPASPPASSSKYWAGVAVAAIVVAAVVAVILVITLHDNDTPTSRTPVTVTAQPSTEYSAPESTTTSAYTPPPDPEVAAIQQLQAFKAQDASIIAGVVDRWIPQLSSKSSKEPWTDDSEDNRVYDPVRILQEHQQLRQQYGAVLIWAGDWTTYDGPDFWITVVPQSFSDSSGALNWCGINGRDRDHCSAQIVSKTLGSNGTHAN
jgi:serine/threonine protein kinase